MGSVVTNVQQEFDVDFSKESYEYFPFIVTCVYRTLWLLSSGLCAGINLTFQFFCSFVFNSFKLVYLMFQMFETLLAFSRSLLQFNYILVSRALTVLGQVASKSSLFLQLLIASLHKTLISSYKYIQNLPFLCYQKTVYVLTVLQEFSLAISDRIVSSFVAGYQNFIIQLSTLLSTCSRYTLDAITAFGYTLIHLVTDSFSQLVHIFQALHKQAESFVEDTVNVTLVPILRGASFAFNSVWMFLETMSQFFISAGQNFSALIFETTRHINVIFEQVGEWITMPFSFHNLTVMLESIILLLKNIINIFVLTISLSFGLLKSCLAVVLEFLSNTLHLLMGLKKHFTFVSFWSIFAMLTCFTIFILIKNIYVFHKVMTLLKSVRNLFSPLRQQRNFIQHAPDRLEQEVEEEMLLRNGNHDNIRRIDEKPIVDEAEGRSVTAIQETVKEDDDLTVCIVCQDEQRSTVLLPCRHLCLCRDCAESLQNNIERRKRKCPLCRENIQDVMDVYI